MLAGDFLHDGQTQATAAHTAGVGPVKPLKNMGLVPRRNADARVLHLQPARSHPHRHGHARTGMHQCVVHQVAQSLLNQQRHALHHAVGCGAFKAQIVLLRLCLVPHGLRHFAGQGHQVHRLHRLQVGRMFGAGQRQQLLGQVHRVVGGADGGCHGGTGPGRQAFAPGQRQLRLEHGQRRAQLVRGVVQKALADINQTPQPLYIAVECVDQRLQLARVAGRRNG